MRCLQVVLVDHVLDAFALVLADVLRVGILQFLVVLNREILPLSVLLEFLSLLVPSGRHGQASLYLDWVISVERLVGLRAAALVIAVLELIVELELSSLLVDVLRLGWLQERRF